MPPHVRSMVSGSIFRRQSAQLPDENSGWVSHYGLRDVRTCSGRRWNMPRMWSEVIGVGLGGLRGLGGEVENRATDAPKRQIINWQTER
jgi:hypothetical protein